MAGVNDTINQGDLLNSLDNTTQRRTQLLVTQWIILDRSGYIIHPEYFNLIQGQVYRFQYHNSVGIYKKSGRPTILKFERM